MDSKREIDLFNADCREIVNNVIPDNSIDTIITDPPYGLEFMGKGWDKGVPGVDFWKAFLQVAKPGATLLAFGGTRTFHRMTVAIEDAGWEIRDCMMWLYGSGFPKSHNLHGDFEGWGTALKPAWEPIIVAMKPLDGTFAANAEKHGVAGINIDGARIGTDTVGWGGWSSDGWEGGLHKAGDGRPVSGRWPANLILDEEAGEMLDEQSGITKSTSAQRNNKPSENLAMSGANMGHISSGHDDSGGASRFFYCAKASKSERNKGLEALVGKETHRYGAGIGEGLTPDAATVDKNFHPTVKPIKLMEYLCTLTKTPTGGTVLDPFMGSGTTGIAAKNTGRSFIGIEQSADYFKIAEARINGVSDSANAA